MKRIKIEDFGSMLDWPQKVNNRSLRVMDFFKDSDRDGLMNGLDCEPFNRRKQDTDFDRKRIYTIEKARLAQLGYSPVRANAQAIDYTNKVAPIQRVQTVKQLPTQAVQQKQPSTTFNNNINKNDVSNKIINPINASGHLKTDIAQKPVITQRILSPTFQALIKARPSATVVAGGKNVFRL